jgi:hypothetical protein
MFRKSAKKFKFHYNITRITGTLQEDLYTFLNIFRSVLLRIKNVSDKSRRKNQNIFMINIFS